MIPAHATELIAMKMKVELLILGLLLIPSALLSQPQVPSCQARALRTVDEARTKAILGEKDNARELLRQADRECGISQAVKLGICGVHKQLGDEVLASLYCKNAESSSARSELGTPLAIDKDTPVREKFALVVGIGTFEDPRIPHLKYAAKDARDFASALTDPGIGRFYRENVAVLTDQQATFLAIRAALAKIAAKALKDDLVLLYFSTHGSSPASDRSAAGAGHLVTYDTAVDQLTATAYGMHELANFIKQSLRAERIVTFLDTCYSGDTTRFIGGSKALQVDDYSGLIPQGKGTVVVTSSSGRELSWESDERQNSFFTLYLVESLQSREGLGTIREIYTDIQRKIPVAVRDYTRSKGLGEQGKGAEQNPAIYPVSEVPNIIIGAPTN